MIVNSRKGSLFIPFIVVVAFLALIITFIGLSSKDAQLTGGHELGERAFSVSDSYLEGEKALSYLDQSAKYSAQLAMNDIATRGIAQSTDCGSFEGYPLWNTEDKECYPENDALKREFANTFSNHLDQYLVQYPLARFPLANYEFTVSEENNRFFIYGYAIQNLEFPIKEPTQKVEEEKESEIPETNAFSIWPVAGQITTCFGLDSTTFPGRTRWHDAIDISATTGTSVKSVADGNVEKIHTGCGVGDCYSGTCGGTYGNHVIIKHDKNLYTLYAHLSSVSVKEGDDVKAGQEIGRVGNTGKSCGAHLHFAVHKKAVTHNSEQDYEEDPFCYLPRVYQGYQDPCTHVKCPEVKLTTIKEGCAEDKNEEELLQYVDKRISLGKYVPDDLVLLSTYDIPSRAGMQLKGTVIKDLQDLIFAAKDLRIPLEVCSGYVSYNTQTGLFEGEVSRQMLKGLTKEQAEAVVNSYIIMPGYSDYQLGTTIDFTTSGISCATDAFENTAASRWLAEHAEEYGFVLSYPKGKEALTGYQYEPWHYRYVGKRIAQILKEKNYRDISNDWTLNKWLTECGE